MSTSEVARRSRDSEERIRGHIERTPLQHSPTLGDEVYLKCENLQVTGSFKARGAVSKLTGLTPEEVAKGVVAASTGNHGAAVAYAAQRVGSRATVFVPSNAKPNKLDAIAALGGEVRVYGDDSVEAEAEARRHADTEGATYVSPYNDLDVIAGQGTIGLELIEDLERVDDVVIAVGGGGLLSGVGSVLKERSSDTRVIACSPENSAVMERSLRAGQILDIPSLPTISDGTAGGVEKGSVTFDLCRDLVDEFVTVSEEEVIAAMRSFANAHDMPIEGSAGVALAAHARLRAGGSSRITVIVLCGGNISEDHLRRLA